MIVADSLVGSIHVRHTGRVIEEVTSGSVDLVERMPVTIDAIARWREAHRGIFGHNHAALCAALDTDESGEREEEQRETKRGAGLMPVGFSTAEYGRQNEECGRAPKTSGRQRGPPR